MSSVAHRLADGASDCAGDGLLSGGGNVIGAPDPAGWSALGGAKDLVVGGARIRAAWPQRRPDPPPSPCGEAARRSAPRAPTLRRATSATSGVSGTPTPGPSESTAAAEPRAPSPRTRRELRSPLHGRGARRETLRGPKPAGSRPRPRRGSSPPGRRAAPSIRRPRARRRRMGCDPAARTSPGHCTWVTRSTARQDALIRMRRMPGHQTPLDPWAPITPGSTFRWWWRRSSPEGPRATTRPRGFVERVWEWRRSTAPDHRAVQAARRLIDYERERFTLDEGYVRAVYKVFVGPLPQGADLPRQVHGHWDPGTHSGDLRPGGREARGGRRPLRDQLPGRGLGARC